MAKISKILLFSFLIGIVLTIASIWPYGKKMIIAPTGGCFYYGGPFPFLGSCIENKIFSFEIDIVFWFAIVFGLWMLIKFLKKKKK